MAVRTITTSIALDGEQKFKQQIGEVNRELTNLKTEMRYTEEVFKGQANTTEALTAKSDLLKQAVDQQTEKVKALEKAVKESAEAYGDTNAKTDSYRAQLNKARTELVKMERELEDTNEYLEEAESSFDGCAKSIDEFGKETDGNTSLLDKFNDKLGKFKGAIAGGIAAKFTIEGAKEVMETILELEESTREYRKLMGSIETLEWTRGWANEEIYAQYDRLYGVLGDAEATTNSIISLNSILAGSQEDMLYLIDVMTGAWAELGEAVPIEALSEGIAETIKTGQAAGAYADALNLGTTAGENFGVTLKENIEFTELSKKELDKLSETQRAEYEATKAQYDAIEAYNQSVLDATTAEEYFNIALQETQTEQERLDLIMQNMVGMQYVGEDWRMLNADIIAANESQNRMEQAMGRLGEAVAPAANAIRNVGASAIEFLADTIEGAIGLIQDFLGWWEKFNSTEAEKAVNDRRTAARGGTTTMTTREAIAMVEGDRSVEAQEMRTTASMISRMADIDSGGGSTSATAAGSSETINITVVSNLDGKKVGEGVTTYQRNNQRAVGR